jgi:ATP-dependent DNA helicase RecG
MTGAEPEASGPVDASPPSPPPTAEEARLPLRELDRALAPVRRSVRSALDRGSVSPYLGPLLAPHLAAATALALPGALLEALGELRGLVDALPADGDALARLADVSARLSRVDALAGLPLPFHPRPVPKVRQVDQPEVAAPPPSVPAPRAPAPAPVATEAAPPPPAPEASAPAPALAPPPPVDDEEEDDDGPMEFAGDLSVPVSEVTPLDLAAAGAAALPGLGFESVRDLAWCRPSRVERLTPVHGAGRQIPAGRVAVGGRVTLAFTVLRPDGGRDRGALLTGAGPLRLRWAPDSLRPPAPQGRTFPKVVVAGTLVAGDPAELVDAEVVEADGHTATVPSWDLPGVPDRVLRQLFRSWATGWAQVRDPLPPEAVRRHGLAALGDAIEACLTRASDAGRRRMAFDEALLVQAAPVLVRGARDAAGGSDRGIGHTLLHGLVGSLGQTASLELDDGAQAILEDVKRDLRRNVPSRRVITSEVGGGKGRLALVAAVMVAEAKNQVLILGADAVDAEQRFLLAEPLLKEAGVACRLLSGASTPGQREALRRGEIQVVFAGPELLEEGVVPVASGDADRGRAVAFRRLGLMIAFEREQFGLASAVHARLPGPRPHLLVVPVVPVGVRILTTAYADHQVSLYVDPARRPARITLCGADERLAAYVRLREAVDGGDQGVVVFPTVDGADAFEIPDALRLVRALEGDALKGVRVALLHGAMAPHDRARVVDDVLHRRVQVLVSTTRVEDLPTIPGATMVIVEQADRMEQWRLHRVIGFFSRANKPATAVLVVGENAEPESAARVDRVVSAPSGFALTEALVQLRGIERSVADGAAPPASWRWVDPDADLALVLAARDEAHRLLRADPTLRRGAPAELATWLRRRWAELWPGADPQAWPCPIRDDGPVEPRKKRRRRRRKR